MESPRLSLGRWPTPVRRLEHASDRLGVDVWAKVEDGSGTWSANKVRKLEYLLADARRRGIEALSAYGVGSSTWCAALAHYGAAVGFRISLALAGTIPDALGPAYASGGVNLTILPGYVSLPAAFLLWRARALGRTAALPAGGSGGLGDLGSARAGAELAASVDSGDLPAPERAFVAMGTAGTAAGLACGLAAHGLTTAVTAVRVTPRPLGTRSMLRRRIANLQERLRLGDRPIVQVDVDDGFHRPGYGRPNPDSIAAAELGVRDGLDLDATYAAKAFAALIAAARQGAKGPLLLLDTSPAPLPPTKASDR